MYKKIFSTSVLNTATAGINFLSSFIIIKVLSLEIFGEFAIFSSYLVFGGLIYAIIPSNFSIFKLQDDKNFKTILLSFFILSSILFFPFVFFVCLSGLIKIDIWTVYFFGMTTFFLGYFDIKFQALGKLNKYFFMLFIISALKIVTLGIFYYADQLNNLSNLLWTMTLVQAPIILYYLVEDKVEIKHIITQKSTWKTTILYIKVNFIIFKHYYLNTFLKRIRENVIVLIFSRFISIDVIGLFSLFVKITSFVLGLSRTLEAFFMNRENIKEYRSLFYQKIFYFSFFLQLLFLGIGLIYLKIFVDKYYFFEILIQSFLVYPHVYFLLARSEMLSKYNNKEVNISEVLYMTIALLGAGISFSFNFTSIYPILITFISATFGLQLYMIYSHKIRNKYHD